MQIVLTGVKPYDGRYQLDFDEELTTREWGWIKRLAGYLPLGLEEAAVGGDPEFACVLAVIAMRRAGRIDAQEVPAMFDRLVDAPFGSSLTIDADDEPVPDEDDAGPPVRSSNGNEPSSGTGSATSSGTSQPSLPGSGIPGSAFSRSDHLTSAS